MDQGAVNPGEQIQKTRETAPTQRFGKVCKRTQKAVVNYENNLKSFVPVNRSKKPRHQIKNGRQLQNRVQIHLVKRMFEMKIDSYSS